VSIGILLLAVVPRCLAGAIGSTIFSNPASSPSIVASTGGVVSITIQAADPVTIRTVSMQIRYPDGSETNTGLILTAGGAASGVWGAATGIARNFYRFDQYLTLIFSSQNANGQDSRSDPLTVILQGTGGAGPQLAFTALPFIGSTDPVSAITLGAIPTGTVFGMNILIPGLGWFTKPQCKATTAEPVVLSRDGSVTVAYATGGIDQLATIIVGYLFPADAVIPCLSGVDSVPSSFAAQAIAVTSVARTPPATLTFAGFNWTIKDPGIPVGPGNNYFIADNVFTDSQGLHLKLSQCQMAGAPTWCGSEVFANTPTGYGTYVFTLHGPLSTLGKNTVVGMFLFGDSSAFAHHEIDFEFWKKSSDSVSAQFTVQPASANPPHRFAIPAGLSTATVSIAWTPSEIVFSMWQGSSPASTASTLIEEWVYSRTSSLSDVPPNGDEEIHLNVWTQNPSNIDPTDAAEIVISNVSFMPYQPSILPFGIVSAASYEAGGVAPGEVLSIFGNNLGPLQPAQSQPSGSVGYPKILGTSQVFFDGVPAPLISASEGQINLIAPFEIGGQASTVIQVSNGGMLSDPVRLAANPSKPGIFTLDQSGHGPAAVINVDGSVNAPANPAVRGSSISIYGTGGGQTNPQSFTGQITSTGLFYLVGPVTVMFGEILGTVTYDGAAPLEIGGLFQMNVTIPANAPIGPTVPLIVVVGGWTSQINGSVAIQ
jgi:uncharacterized protein (TIGR03437 family)